MVNGLISVLTSGQRRLRSFPCSIVKQERYKGIKQYLNDCLSMGDFKTSLVIVHPFVRASLFIIVHLQTCKISSSDHHAAEILTSSLQLPHLPRDVRMVGIEFIGFLSTTIGLNPSEFLIN